MASSLRRFLHPYYLLNSLLFLSYVGLRIQRLSGAALSMRDMFGITRETQIYVCLLLMLITRLLSAPTLDAYLSSAFSFARVTVLFCLYHMNLSLFVAFLILWCAIYALCPQPRYKLPKSVTTLNPVTFRARVDPNVADKTVRSIHIIWCHASWSSRCSQLTPVLASLVNKFEHPRIHFSRVDVSRFTDVADALKLTAAPTSKELPCVIVFKQTEEIARIPITNSQGRIPKQYIHGFTAKEVANALDLQGLYDLAVKWETDAQRRYKQMQKN